jgi:hypothetical protein
MSKRALLVGINQFIRPSWKLRGCINDTAEIQALLTSYYGFADTDLKIIHDSDASAQGIRDGLSWLLRDYDNDGSDVRVFHFSSHGTQVDDQGTDEWERLDEVIVTYDHDWKNPFRDDELKVFFDTIPDNVNFTFIADCCHSGTMQRAAAELEFRPRYLYPDKDVQDRIETLRQERDAKLDAYVASHLGALMQGVPPAEFPQKMLENMQKLREQFKNEHYAVVPYEKHFLLAACESEQTAADARIAGDWRGAFTWALGQAIRQANGDVTYDDLIKIASGNISQYDQRPQLECPQGLGSLKLFAPLV